MEKYWYFAARLPLAFSFFGHGLVRLPKLDKFSDWMLTSMEKSILPAELVRPFSYALPILEFAIGLLLLLGLFTRQSLFAGLFVMAILVFGSTTVENWDAITSQLVHAGYFAVLLYFVSSNTLAVDNFFVKKVYA
ncbi:MauE/DoxX family redox-associated membrane protein [Flavobacterium sp.]|uniref:DoxX family membrane protein n=1 Tax=Flavobacterium sp. TaxID=239 RepID=UPI0011FB6A25|nr:MauE/DoxX family redox-associated membrane protein [Flavobacterium sp.]RZJ72232.1 MAG: DoxX family membrane protein [Flavobacterium sp.]